MKKKIIIMIVLLISITVLLNCKIYAHNVDIDPKSYITMPSNIFNNKGIIYVNSSVESGYTLYYQKVDISNTIYNKLQAKDKEVENYINVEKTKLTQEEANVNSLKDKYQEIMNDKNATEEEVQLIYDECKNAINLYNKHIETYNAKLNEIYSEIKNLIPAYQENDWTKAIGTSNNVNLDFSNYSGQVNFALWAKLVTSTGTYYDVNCYSSNIEVDNYISLDKTTEILEVGKTLKLNATTNSSKDIIWTSNKENIVTVDINGNVKAISEGIAVITAKKKLECK